MILILIICILQGILFTNVHTVRSYVDGDVRLADVQYTVSTYYNIQFVFGRVEVSYESNWGTVCWNRWSYYESRTVCKEIGYHDSSDWRPAGPDRIIQDRVILLDNLYCNHEERLIDCRHNGYNDVRDGCTHYDDVWVQCKRYLPAHIPDLPIRLISQQAINGYNSQDNTYLNENKVIHAGLIQAKLYGAWHYISGVGWDLVDARIACRQLGYPDVIYIPEYDIDIALSDDQLIQVTMENLDCTGNERELKECYHDGWRVSDYDVANLAGVNCETKEQFLSSKETVFRLRGGSSYWEGRLEILHELSWGTVCGREFTLTQADIACKSFGLGRAQEVFNTASSGYGRGIGKIWIGDFDCSGSLLADSLLECDYSDWGLSTCRNDHAWDVGIRCQVPRPERKVRILRRYIPRQYTMQGVNFYYTEIYHEGIWSSPCCYTLLSGINTNRLCREFGLGFGVPQLSRCETDPYKRQQSGLSGYIICDKEDYFSGTCRSYFRKLDHCYDGYDVIACADKLPDLVPSLSFFERSLRYYNPEVGAEVRDDRERNRIEFSTVGDLTCAIEDECLASSADRNNPSQEIKLLRFSSHTDNFGLLPLYPPIPESNWLWHNCHNHFHSMEVFVSYHLLDRDGNRVAEGHKASFCLEDSLCVNQEDRYFYCDETQGISVNCGDHYGAELDCQWIDITDVQPGNYIVEVTVNPVKSIIESNYDNNVLSCMIELDEDGFYSTDNCLHSDHILERKQEEEYEIP